MNHARVITLALAVSSLSIIFACSSAGSPSANDGTSTETPMPTPTATATGPKGGPVPRPSPDGPPDDGTSSSSGGVADGGGPDPAKVACFAKCQSDNPQGFDEFAAILQPCACAPAVCGTVCGKSCAGTPAELLATTSAACGKCLNDSLAEGAVCNKAEVNGCLKKPKCPGFAICAQGCQ